MAMENLNHLNSDELTRYNELRLEEPNQSVLSVFRKKQLGTYQQLYNDLLIRLIPTTIKAGVNNEVLGQVLRRSVIPAFKQAQKNTVDRLTGLPTRETLHSITSAYMDMVRGGIRGVVTYVFIDVDNFKSVNDTYTHNDGDILLKELGKLFSRVKRPYDFAGREQELEHEVLEGRIAGDEFGFVFFGSQPISPELLKTRIENGLDEMKQLKGFKEIGISIGVATYTGKEFEYANELISAADMAMYHAKSLDGKVKFVQYQPNMTMPDLRGAR